MYLHEVPDDLSAKLLPVVSKVGKAVMKLDGVTGYNVVQNNGKSSGQVVFHAHVHVIPRKDDDGLIKLPKSGPMISADVANPLKEKLKSHM